MKTTLKTYRRALTIAGSDPSGGAGLQADLKTFSALGVYGMSAVVAVVDENTVGVTGVHPVPPSFVAGQIHSCMSDIGADAIKIGMLHSAELIRTVADALTPYDAPVVLDPVMVATSGDALLRGDAVDTLLSVLIPRAELITPNIPEAEILLGAEIRECDELADAARELSERTGVSVLLKAGHLRGADTLTDILYDRHTGCATPFGSARVATANTHGTGCTLSSAIAAWLAHGASLAEAVGRAKDYISAAITAGASYSIGHGHGPVHHFHRWWQS